MKNITIVISLFVSVSTLGQQIPQYSQWYMHQFSRNPAHAGIKECVDIHSLYRLQWVGFKGAPRSGFLTVSIPIHMRRKKYLGARHGTGFRFETDQIGQFSINRINAAYAAHFNFDKYRRISFGLFAGIMQMGYNPSSIQTIDPDPEVMREGSFVAPDASFGAWYNDENYYFGISLHNLIPSPWQNIGNSSRNRFHMSLSGGYRFALNDNLSLIAAGNVRVPPAGPVSLDLNLHMDYRNLIGFGVGYRNTDGIIGFFSLKIKEQFSIGYSFDYNLSKIQLVAKNTHEISLTFSTCKPQKVGTASCPLFE